MQIKIAILKAKGFGVFIHMDKAWFFFFRRMWAAVQRGDKQTWNYLWDALAKGEIVLQSPLSEGQFLHPGSLGEKAAVSIWGRKWCRIKVASLCLSPLAPEYTSLPSICGSDIKLGFQLLFPCQCSQYLQSHPTELFLWFPVFIGVFTMTMLSLQSGVLEHFISVAHPLPVSLPTWLLLQTKIIIEISHTFSFFY